MRHVDSHPEPVEGCFGCKALTIGTNMASSADPGLTRTRTDDHGTHQVDVTEHYRGDRQDVLVRNPPAQHGDLPFQLDVQKARASKDPEVKRRLHGIFT